MDDRRTSTPEPRPWWRRAIDAVFGRARAHPDDVWSLRGQIAGLAILAVIPASFVLGASDPEERLHPVAMIVIAAIGVAVIRYARNKGGG